MTRFYYAEYCPYGAGTISDCNDLRAFVFKQERDNYVDRLYKYVDAVSYDYVQNHYTAAEINVARTAAEKSTLVNVFRESDGELTPYKSLYVPRDNAYDNLVNNLMLDGLVSMEIAHNKGGHPTYVFKAKDECGRVQIYHAFIERWEGNDDDN